MIISQNGAVDLIPEYNRALRPIFCVSEGDANSRTINLTVTSAGEVFTIPEGAEVYVAGKKQDNTIFTYQCAYSGYIVSFPVAEQMSAANGLVLCELQIVVAGDPLGSANFCYWVEPSPIANGSSSESDLNIFEQAIAALGGYEYLTSEVSVLSARMDQFARLPDGSLSTAADAELADVRVMANGSTAATAGDAVREQVTEINDNLEPYTSEVWYRKLFERKALGINIGRPVAVSNSNIRLSIADLQHADNSITITVDSGYRFGVATCDSNNICLSDSGWKTAAYTIPAGTYFHITMSKTDNTEIALNEISNLHVDEAGFSAVDRMYSNINETFDEFNSIISAENLAVIKDYIEGFISTDGPITPASDSNERTTGFIELDSTGKVTVQQWGTPVNNGLWTGVGYYDADKTFITRQTYLKNEQYSVNRFTAPSNAVYCRVSFRQGEDILLMVQLGTLASPYRMSKADIYALNHESTFTFVPYEYALAFVKSINHRGYNTVAPENTLPAYRLSKIHNFEYVETDVEFTSDNVAVLLHDATIDRTSNGSGRIADMTYAEALEYDFGSWKSLEYTGTRIPTFAEFIALCKNIGLKPYVELKTGTRAQIEGLVDTVKKYGMTDVTTWISFQATLLSYVIGKDEKARIGFLNAYGTDVSSTDIEKAQALQTGENEVFIDVQIGGLTSAGVGLAVDAGIPVEVYDGTATNVLTMDAYVTGVTSDKVVTSKALYDANIE